MSSQTTYTAESSSRPRYRKRTVSLTSLSSVQSRITLDLPKAQPALSTTHTRAHSAYGSFIPTPSAHTNLDHLTRSFNLPLSTRLPRLSRTPSRWVEEDDSPLSSGTSSPTIPSFSRTASPPPILSPSLASSSTTLHTLAESSPGHIRKQSNELDPILAKLERRSKLLTKKVYCGTCNKAGSDYPKCGRCDAMWCSRECRMFGGKRHVCASRTLKDKQ
ncbi:hypothetical protein D9615_002929 [Tricholomella constricta]|uniref:Uncharacterized protein n=1 Tax=Tricholomella constricta TaxID=117010 RepID=A0A8H5M677_9AGAR|nr:hypothetical protein D9615_002929 [Tricholomella constricta]